MSQFPQPIRLGEGDLYSPRVEAYLEEQAVLNRGVPEVEPQPLIVRLIFSSYFYLSIASGLGAFVAWAIMEPFFDDPPVENPVWVGIFLFPLVAGFVGLFLGATEGIMCRNLQRAVVSAVVGFGIGFAGGLVVLIPAGVVYAIMEALAASLRKPDDVGPMPKGIALCVHMIGRSLAWSLAAVPAGLGQGIALREKKVAMNGLLGGVLGGLIGGLLFDPIGLAFAGPNGQGDLSRCVGFTFIGLMVGLFVGLVEQWTKTAWLLMRAGPLAGKQFIIYRNPAVLGSSPKADIYLFKDEAIEPQHALVHNFGGRYEIEDWNTADGTYVNGIPVTKQILKPGDQIVLGKTVLEFALKETS
ncbi:MAG: FHA domain-containing protein [Isosphaeraceae bacterium]|nr:FHA domain-containing protein [Isosphaeraceae bacterium]